MAAVIGFGAVGGAAEAEKALRVGIGAKPEVLDVPDSRAAKPRGDIAGKVEQGMAVARGRCEEAARWPDLRRQSGP